MTQYALGTIDPAVTDGTELADGINGWAAAVHSNHRGAVRPEYAVAGMIWPKSVSASLTEINYFDGTADHLLLSVNPATGLAVAANAFLRDAANLNAGKLPIDRLTAADLLALLLTVDGAASGLDAQLLAGTSLAGVLSRANHTGTQPLSSVVGADDAANLSTGKLHIDRLTAADLLALLLTVDGAASGLDAQLLAGSSIATILDRANHTGVQTLATISDAGDAAGRNVGLLAGNVVGVQAGGKLPALDGSDLTNVGGGLKSVQVITASGTWTRPAGVTKVMIYVTGGGGAGAGLDTNTNRTITAGAGGGTAIKFLDVSAIASATLVVGAGGGHGVASSSGGWGSSGTDSSWSDGTNTITGGGGARGRPDPWETHNMPQGGVATGGDINCKGMEPVLSGMILNSRMTGGASFWGAGGQYGVTQSVAASDGVSYGSGGGSCEGASGGSIAGSGGYGAQGVIYIMEYC